MTESLPVGPCARTRENTDARPRGIGALGGQVALPVHGLGRDVFR